MALKEKTVRGYPIKDIELDDLYHNLEDDHPSVQRLKSDFEQGKILLNPVVLQWDTNKIIAGRKRIRSYLLLGKRAIYARIVDIPDEEIPEYIIRENLNREHLSSLEQADLAVKLEELEKANNPDHPKYQVGRNPDDMDEKYAPVKLAHEYLQDATNLKKRRARELTDIVKKSTPRMRDFLVKQHAAGNLNVEQASLLTMQSEDDQDKIVDHLQNKKNLDKAEKIAKAIATSDGGLLHRTLYGVKEKPKVLKEVSFESIDDLPMLRHQSLVGTTMGKFVSSNPLLKEQKFSMLHPYVYCKGDKVAGIMQYSAWNTELGNATEEFLYKVKSMFPKIRVDHGTFENNDINGNFLLNSKTKIKAKQLGPVLLGTSKIPELFDIPEEENKYKAFIESKKELKKQYEQWVENEEK